MVVTPLLERAGKEGSATMIQLKEPSFWTSWSTVSSHSGARGVILAFAECEFWHEIKVRKESRPTKDASVLSVVNDVMMNGFFMMRFLGVYRFSKSC